ncbi:MAG: hypothetical protein AAGC60_21940 [Acidobacteriota bacterium]
MTRRRLTLLASAGVLLLAGVVAVQAYPIPPVPLWGLVAKADLIVVAEVVEVAERDADEDDWNSAVARLEVIDALKGETGASIEVPFPAGLMCPAPPHYEPGERVLAFLSRDDGGWRTVALSYGTLYPDDEALEDFRLLIDRAIDLQTDEKAAERAPIDWLVRAAALPGTRWHGLYELAPWGDRIRSFYDRGDRRGRLGELRPRHAELLAESILRHAVDDPTLPQMLVVLAHHDDPRIDALAAGVVEVGLRVDSEADPGEEQVPWWLRDVLGHTLLRYDVGEQDLGTTDALFEEIESASLDRLRQIWADAKAELDLGEIEPVELDAVPYRPVGGRTPS